MFFIHKNVVIHSDVFYSIIHFELLLKITTPMTSHISENISEPIGEYIEADPELTTTMLKKYELEGLIKRYRNRFPKLSLAGDRVTLLNRVNEHGLLEDEQHHKTFGTLSVVVQYVHTSYRQIFKDILHNNTDVINVPSVAYRRHFSAFEASILADILLFNTNLKVLNIASQYIDDKPLSRILKNILSNVQIHRNMISLDISTCNIGQHSIVELVELLPNIEQLNMKLCHTSISNLVSIIKKSNRIMNLNIQDAAPIVQEYHQNELVELVNAFKSLLMYNEYLVELNIEGNNFGDVVGVAIAEALRYNDVLNILHMKGNRLTKTTASAFNTTMLTNWSIVEFSGVGGGGVHKRVSNNKHNYTLIYMSLLQRLFDIL